MHRFRGKEGEAAVSRLESVLRKQHSFSHAITFYRNKVYGGLATEFHNGTQFLLLTLTPSHLSDLGQKRNESQTQITIQTRAQSRYFAATLAPSWCVFCTRATYPCLVFHQSNRVSAITRMLFYYRHKSIFALLHVQGICVPLVAAIRAWASEVFFPGEGHWEFFQKCF